jgi:outer membrane protein
VYKKLTIWSMWLLMLLAVPAAAEMKIAVLDAQRALVESEEAQALLQQLQDELQPEEEQVQALAQEIIDLQTKLRTDAEVMSPTEQRKIQKDIDDKKIDYQFLGNKLQKEARDRQQELMQQMEPKITVVLEDLTELEGYDLILPRASVFYVNSKHDITRRVTEKLNEKQ